MLATRLRLTSRSILVSQWKFLKLQNPYSYHGDTFYCAGFYFAFPDLNQYLAKNDETEDALNRVQIGAIALAYHVDKCKRQKEVVTLAWHNPIVKNLVDQSIERKWMWSSKFSERSRQEFNHAVVMFYAYVMCISCSLLPLHSADFIETCFSHFIPRGLVCSVGIWSVFLLHFLTSHTSIIRLRISSKLYFFTN